RWALAADRPAPDWVERFRPKPGDPPHAVHEPSWDPRIALWENPHPLPRAFVVYAADVVADDEAQARALPRLDPRHRVLLDRAPEPAPSGGAHDFTPAKVTRAERHAVSVEADAARAGVLVVSETWYPGWSVTVDGKPAPLLRADYAFRGVALTP